MSIINIHDCKEGLELLRNGICPQWGFLPDNAQKRSLTRGKWTVNIEGDICFDNYYHIQKDRLQERDWITHLMSKTWFDFNEFIPVFMQAHFNAGHKEVRFGITH